MSATTSLTAGRKVFIDRYLNGDIAGVYPDFEMAQPVRVLPETNGSNFGGAESLWSFVGPTRHPYKCVIRESEYGTTVHVDRRRLEPRSA